MDLARADGEQSETKLKSIGAWGRDAVAAYVTGVFRSAGVELNGTRPFDPRVVSRSFYPRVLSQGSLGLGESYVEGDWECDHLDALVDQLLRGGLGARTALAPAALLATATRRLTNAQRATRAAKDVPSHYDRDDGLYEAMLDSRMTYSCGYWRDAANLEQAQEAKLELVCRKLGLTAGQTVLDIGCGWGSFARHAAERHGVRVVGVTISPKQARLGMERCRGLPVELLVRDYRELGGQYDHVVSIGMFEHVGVKNYRTFLKTVGGVLKPGGLFLLHTIGSLESGVSFEPWMDRHIFPGAQLPSARQLAEATEGLFVIEDLHNFGADYDRTLLAWRANFDRAWDSLRGRYDERFRRMWRYYLSFCAGTFRARFNQLYQLVLSKEGVPGGYRSVR